MHQNLWYPSWDHRSKNIGMGFLKENLNIYNQTHKQKQDLYKKYNYYKTKFLEL